MQYVRNACYVAGCCSELKPEVPNGVTILGEPIVFWRDAQGTAHALQDRCVQRNAPLSLGRCERSLLRCMYHGFLFDGHRKVVEIPAQSKYLPTPESIQPAGLTAWLVVGVDGNPKKADA